MRKPEMIIFDYGNTLLWEPGFSTLRGQEALHSHIIKNTRGLTAAEINRFADGIYARMEPGREQGYEFHNHNIQRLIYELLDIELDVGWDEAEDIFWDSASYGAKMPGIDTVLALLKARRIRSGVLSNIAFSGRALKKRIDRLLPDNQFEFVLASSEYGFRKPCNLLFSLALVKAGLTADKIWFCGDNVSADIWGAEEAGMFPIWYDEKTAENQWLDRSGAQPGREHLHIHNWHELTELLEELCETC